MSWDKFEDDCAGCRPVMFDAKTGQCMSPNSKPMVAMMRCWNSTTLQQRQAWHRVTCQNSRAPLDLIVINEMRAQWEKEMKGEQP